MSNYTRSHAQGSGFGLQMLNLRAHLAAKQKEPKSHTLRSLQIALLGSLLILGCGGSQTQIKLFPTVHAQGPTGICGLLQDGSNTEFCGMKAEWAYRHDSATNRFVAMAAVGQTNWDTGISSGVPPLVRIFLYDANKPADWPYQKFCIDTLHIGVKQPSGTNPSVVGITLLPGSGRPAWSVFSGEATSHIDKVCYDSASPNPDERFPYLFIQNQWTNQQVISLVIAGEVRP